MSARDPIAPPEGRIVLGQALIDFGETDGAGFLTLVRDTAYEAPGLSLRLHAWAKGALVRSNGRNLRRTHEGALEIRTEELVFVGTTTAKPAVPATRLLRADWQGGPGPELNLLDGAFHTAEAQVGAVRVVYETLFDRWIMDAAPYPLVVAARLGDLFASLVVRPEADGGWAGRPGEPHPGSGGSGGEMESGAGELQREYELLVVNHCTGDPVPDAAVACAGKVGRSDLRGRFPLGRLSKGVYAVRIEAPGYTPNYADTLDNERIVVD